MSKLNQKELLKIMGDSIEEGRRNIRDLKGNLDISQDEFDKRFYDLNRAEQQIRDLIQIFFAKEISAGPIKKDISRPDLTEWLQGINQAATAVNDYYVMKATTQLIEMMQEIGMDKIFVEKKARELMDLFRRGKEEHDELPLHTAINIVRYMQKPEIKKDWLPTAENINALPKPVRKYIADLETNADPPSMVADNIILRDTIKTLEKMLEERPAVDEGFVNTCMEVIKIEPK